MQDKLTEVRGFFSTALTTERKMDALPLSSLVSEAKDGDSVSLENDE